MPSQQIKLDDISMWVDFDYQPQEPATWEYPGCDEEFDIYSVRVGKDEIDIVNLLSNEAFYAIIRKLNEDTEYA